MGLFGILGGGDGDPATNSPQFTQQNFPGVGTLSVPQIAAPQKSFFDSDDGATGGGFGLGPLSKGQKISLLLSGLSDASGAFAGHQTDNLADSVKSFQASNLQAAQRLANAKIAATYATGDMDKVRAAIMDAAASGGDVSHIVAAAQATQPKVQDIGGAGYAIDPLTGVPKLVVSSNKPPEMRTVQSGNTNINQEWDPTTRAWKQVGIGSRFAPRVPKAAPASSIIPRTGPF